MNQFPRSDFPLINEPPYKPFCYADSAATTHMPHAVIDQLQQYARISHSNVHRAPYRLATLATEMYEEARATLAEFFLGSPEATVFTKSATEALNLVISGLSSELSEKDAIIISIAEHHSAIVPWQVAAQKKGFTIHWVGLNADGEVDIEQIQKICETHHNIRGITVLAASNTTGVLQPIKDITSFAKSRGLWTIVDACQRGLDPNFSMECGADYMVLSAHKMFGPTGVGALLSTPQALERLPEYQLGGGMIRSVTKTHVSFQSSPQRFEAGTPPLQAVAGWAAALKYIHQWDRRYRLRWSEDLVQRGLEVFSKLDEFKLLFEEQSHRMPVFSLVHDRIHPHDLATYLDHLHGVAARAGHHCTMPLMEELGVGSTLRLSFSWYNSPAEIDYCAQALCQAQEFFNV